MNTPSTHDDHSTLDYEPTTVAAAFTSAEHAHEAVQRLHDEGFSDTWIGITKAETGSGYGTTGGEIRVESENWFARFFGEGNESLHDALVKHGVSASDALSAQHLTPGSAIVTVDGANHPELAAQLISECGGQMLTRGFGATGYQKSGISGLAADATGVAAGTMASVPAPSVDKSAYDVSSDLHPTAGATLGNVGNAADDRYATDLPLNDYKDYGKFRGGAAVDENTRLQLREERLRIDKERLSRGAATISKDVVSQTQQVDVPIIREELFIERRPVTGAAATDITGAPIGSDTEVIHVPLTEEKVNVSKFAVVTEEVTVGKRQIEETAHVSETTRKEHLVVDDASSTAGLTTGAGTTAGTSANTRDPLV